MKYILFAALTFAIIGCEGRESKQRRAQEAIKRFILSDIEKPDSYQPIYFDDLTSDTSSKYWRENKGGIELNNLVNRLEDTADVFNSKAHSILKSKANPADLSRAKQYKLMAQSYTKKAELINSDLFSSGFDYNDKATNYKIAHYYSADNGSGEEHFKLAFRLDSAFEIIEVETIKY